MDDAGRIEDVQLTNHTVCHNWEQNQVLTVIFISHGFLTNTPNAKRLWTETSKIVENESDRFVKGAVWFAHQIQDFSREGLIFDLKKFIDYCSEARVIAE